MPQFRLAEPADITIEAGEQVAIAGPNGAGKSLLVDLMTGARPLLHGTPAYDFGPGRSTRVSDNVKYIAFRDAYGDGQEPAYYQQRWNQGDETVWPTVRELLLKSRTTDTEDCAPLWTLLGVDQLLDKTVVQLSSGELRRFQLARSLWPLPRVLVIDKCWPGSWPRWLTG